MSYQGELMLPSGNIYINAIDEIKVEELPKIKETLESKIDGVRYAIIDLSKVVENACTNICTSISDSTDQLLLPLRLLTIITNSIKGTLEETPSDSFWDTSYVDFGNDIMAVGALLGLIPIVGDAISAVGGLFYILGRIFPEMTMGNNEGVLGWIYELMEGNPGEIFSSLGESMKILWESLESGTAFLETFATVVNDLSGRPVGALLGLSEGEALSTDQVVAIADAIEGMGGAFDSATNFLVIFSDLLNGFFGTPMGALLGLTDEESGERGLSDAKILGIAEALGFLGISLEDTAVSLSGFGGGMAGFVETVLTALLGLSDSTTEQSGLIKTTMGDLTKDVEKEYDTLPKSIRSITDNMMQGIWDGINLKQESIVTQVSNFANSVINKFMSIFQINSPSKVTKRIFEGLMEGAELGLSNKEATLFAQTEGIADGVLRRFNFKNVSLAGLSGAAQRLQAMVAQSQQQLAPVAVGGYGGGMGAYVDNRTYLEQTIHSGTALQPSQMSREAEDMLRRSKWQIK